MASKKKPAPKKILKPAPLTPRERATLSRILAKARASKAYKKAHPKRGS